MYFNTCLLTQLFRVLMHLKMLELNLLNIFFTYLKIKFLNNWKWTKGFDNTCNPDRFCINIS